MRHQNSNAARLFIFCITCKLIMEVEGEYLSVKEANSKRIKLAHISKVRHVGEDCVHTATGVYKEQRMRMYGLKEGKLI